MTRTPPADDPHRAPTLRNGQAKVSRGPRSSTTDTEPSVRRDGVGDRQKPETTVPKKQSTAAKKARAAQSAADGKYTALLAGQAVCGQQLDPFGVFPETCARPPHPHNEPCSQNRDFDIDAYKQREAAEWAAEEARRAALTDEQRAQEDAAARWEEEQEAMATAGDFDPYEKYYGDVD